MGVLLRRVVGVAVVLVVNLEIRHHQQERRFRRPQEALCAPGHEVHPVLAREVDGLAVVVVKITLVSVGGPLQLVRRFPQIPETSAMGRRHGAAHFVARTPFARRQVPFADVIRRVSRLPQRGSQSVGVFRQAAAIVPDPVAAGVLPRKDAAARRRAHRLVRKSRSEQHPVSRHGVEVRRQVHGVETHGPDAVVAELVRDNQNDIGPLHVPAGLRRGHGRSGHGCGDARQPLSACRSG